MRLIAALTVFVVACASVASFAEDEAKVCAMANAKEKLARQLMSVPPAPRKGAEQSECSPEEERWWALWRSQLKVGFSVERTERGTYKEITGIYIKNESPLEISIRKDKELSAMKVNGRLGGSQEWTVMPGKELTIAVRPGEQMVMAENGKSSHGFAAVSTGRLCNIQVSLPGRKDGGIVLCLLWRICEFGDWVVDYFLCRPEDRERVESFTTH